MAPSCASVITFPAANCPRAEGLPVPTGLTPLADQPIQFVNKAAGISFCSVMIEKAGTVIPQQVNGYDHATFIGSGAVRLWVDGKWVNDFGRGCAVNIEAGREYVFLTLMDDTMLACVHAAASADSVKEGGI